ncbi:MAG TPA: ATP-dependent helicase, partial [Candidatus Methylacidiphilales bacterium]
ELKRAANVVDYDDLLVLWLQRMKSDPAYAAKLRERWTYVLVDEMQDNNQLNQAILDALDPKTLLVVGDANQSIYSFRGSDVSLIRQFASKRSDTEIYKLESNYRSGQSVLDLANAVVAGTPSALILQSARGSDAVIDCHCYGGPGAEANGVIQWMQARIKAGGKPCETAVLARSSKALHELEIALNANRIRYKKYGGQTIADSAEVKDFISFLRISHNLQDKIALLRALMLFPGIGEGTAAKVIAEHQGSLFGADYWPEPAKELPVWIDEVRAVKPLPEKAKLVEERIKPLILHNYPKDGEERLGTLRALVTSTEGEAVAKTPLADFLDGFTLSRHVTDFHPDDAVTLSTIHSSKGLEWDGVCLIGAGSCQIPHPRSLDAGDIEEERRLFYVAVTRAREDLLLTFPNVTEKGQSQKPSPFVPDAMQWKFFFS